MDLRNSPVISLNPRDNVMLARVDLRAGERVGEESLVAENVPQGHKLAVRPIGKGEPVRKYGQVIGFASRDISTGEHVHLQNVELRDLALDHEFCVDANNLPLVPEKEQRLFNGYLRSNGKVGTRNYIAVISSVTCSATVSRQVADYFNRENRLAEYDNVDGVVALTYGGGCCISTVDEGYQYLTRTIHGYAANPNFGGVLMIGLGCETNQISHIMSAYGLQDSETFKTLTIQNTGGTRQTIEAARTAVADMLKTVNACRRTPQAASHIVLALQCGGSDGYSGFSANPALGHAADLLVQQGGTVVLSETPEIYGAEHLLTRRAASREVAEKLLGRIEWWKDYAARNKAEFNNNPTHGNKAGGLTTILEKSLGAVAKSGTSPLTAVYEYAMPITERGFVFMDTPGFDPVSVTGQVAGGCNLLCFTTGRGSTAGFKPVPCIKLATNTPMYERLKEDMDLNCGGIVTGEETIEEVGQRIFEKILSVASGARTFSEQYDYGDAEFVPWQIGAQM